MFVIVIFEPGLKPNWHATSTIDYLVVICGRAVHQLENVRIELGSGHLVVDRGVRHSLEVLDDHPAVLPVAFIRARPLATGVGRDIPSGSDGFPLPRGDVPVRSGDAPAPARHVFGFFDEQSSSSSNFHFQNAH